MTISALPDLIPARILNEFTYCPRLAWYEWIQAQFEDNPDTAEGTFHHRRVDHPDRRSFESPGDCPVDFEPFHARSVLLSSQRYGLIARIDLLEVDGITATPVDYKRGKAPDLPAGAYDPERVQIAAQSLILRDNGFQVEQGVLYFVASKTRVTIAIDDALIGFALDQIEALRRLAQSGTIPLPLRDSPKCPRCSLVGICLPDETNLLMDGPENEARDHRQEPRRLAPARGDGEPAYILAQGAQVGKSDERLMVRQKGQTLQEIRLHDLSQVNLFGNVQITAQAVRELASAEIPILHLSQGGWFYALTHGFGPKNIELRMKQFATAAQPEPSLGIARAMIQAKIKNQRTLLRRNGPEIDPAVLQALAESVEDAGRVGSIESLLGVEGNAARRYFSGLAGLLKDPDFFRFTDRNRRPPRDPVNAILSFLYAMLAKECAVTLAGVGFDPLCGFLHQPRWGRPALALDLAEEFRPLLADSAMLTLVNTGEIGREHFLIRGGACCLTEAGKKRVIAAWERRLDKLIVHPVFGYSVSYRRVLEIQARLLARVLMGEVGAYPGFVTR